APSAEQRHHERVEDAQRGAGYRRQRGEHEQLLGAEAETDTVQAYGNRAPHHPHGEGQQQRGYRDPQVAGGDLLPDITPEVRVFGTPIGNYRAFGRLQARDSSIKGGHAYSPWAGCTDTPLPMSGV